MSVLESALASGSNFPVEEAAGWVESQSNHCVWAHTFLSRKSYVLTNSYCF